MRGKSYIWSWLCVLMPLAVSAQEIDPKTFREQKRQEMEQYRKQKQQEFTQFREQKRSEFEQFRRQRNREFAEVLATHRLHVQVDRGKEPPVIPQPFVPRPEERVAPVKPKKLPVEQVVAPVRVPKPTAPQRIDKPVVEDKTPRMEVSFLGMSYVLRTARSFNLSLPSTTRQAVSSAWCRVAVDELDPLVYDCQQVRERYQLTDWAYYLFIKEVSRQLVGDSRKNEATLVAGYLLSQSGMDFRFAYLPDGMAIALACHETIYRKTYFKVDGRTYYLMDRNVMEKADIDCKSYSSSYAPCSFLPRRGMNLPLQRSKTIHRQSKRYPEISVDFSINETLIEYYNHHPKIDWRMYALTPMEEHTAEQLLPCLRAAIVGKSEIEAVERILNFLETAFTYGYDDKIWGADRPFFPDETLYYPFSDCEDRAILFSQLIMQLTDLDVVLLHYPNHLATAVRFHTDLQGDYVMVDGHKYMVCDPTGYKPIGHAYDRFKNVAAKVIKLR